MRFVELGGSKVDLATFAAKIAAAVLLFDSL